MVLAGLSSQRRLALKKALSARKIWYKVSKTALSRLQLISPRASIVEHSSARRGCHVDTADHDPPQRERPEEIKRRALETIVQKSSCERQICCSAA